VLARLWPLDIDFNVLMFFFFINFLILLLLVPRETLKYLMSNYQYLFDEFILNMDK
jgi:hypothetical protein